jgi:hypothetical protein
MEGKAAWKSKTLWTNAAIGLAGFYPPAREWISSNPQAFGLIVTILNFGLRSLTGEAVSWKLIDKKL